ncbi:hypothetical protein Tco_0150343 [Tanacetum coccineum]
MLMREAGDGGGVCRIGGGGCPMAAAAQRVLGVGCTSMLSLIRGTNMRVGEDTGSSGRYYRQAKGAGVRGPWAVGLRTWGC